MLALPALQVTNPPIDPLREGLVMSMEMRLGGRGNLLEPGPNTYQQVQLKSPVLLESELQAIQNDKVGGRAWGGVRYGGSFLPDEIEGWRLALLRALLAQQHCEPAVICQDTAAAVHQSQEAQEEKGLPPRLCCTCL